MDKSYRTFFQLQIEPFTTDIAVKDILVTPAVKAVADRIDYAVSLGAIAVITGEIGSGKSTALRYAAAQFHPSEFKTLSLTASSGSILELYRQVLIELGISIRSSSRAHMSAAIKREITDLVRGKKMRLILMIDEASLLRLEVFAELHTLTQFEGDSKPHLPIVLVGQTNLVDNLRFRYSLPLASRVVGKTHLKGVDREGMEQYLLHHLTLAGVSRNIFDDTAVTAIHQGAGGLLRKANHLARGAIIVAAKMHSTSVTAEHVRIASTEIF